MKTIFLILFSSIPALIHSQTVTVSGQKAEYKSITVNDMELHYQDNGKGNPLILIHGSLADLRYWEEQTPVLSEHYRVISYSRRYNYPNQNMAQPNHSAIIEAEDLLALLDELEIEQASVLGHSYGAYTALWFALDHPERVHKLILAEAPVLRWLPDISGGEGRMENFLTNIWQPIGKAYSESGEQAGLELTSQWYFSAPLDSIASGWQIYFTQNSKEWEALTISADAFPEIERQKIENLKLPVLLISGARNTGNFNDLIDRHLSELLSDGRRVIIDNAGHEMFQDNPVQTNRVIVSFLRD